MINSYFYFLSYGVLISIVLTMAIISFIMFRYDPFKPSLFIVFFYHEGCWVLFRSFCVSIDIITSSRFILDPMYVQHCLLIFVYADPSLHPGIKPSWTWYIIFSYAVEFDLQIFYWSFKNLFLFRILVCSFLPSSLPPSYFWMAF